MDCPYCFAVISEPVLVCRNEKCTLYDQAMPARHSRLRGRIPSGMRIRGGALLADRETRCDACHERCRALCGACGREIPDAWLRYPRKTVLFLGMNGVGKSTLLAMTKLKLSQKSDLLLTPLEPEDTAERFYERYISPLAERNEDVPHTENELPKPFLWGVSRRFSSRRASALALAVYDVPGEMLSSHAEIAPVDPLVTAADGVILAMNPASLPSVHAACGAPASIAPAYDAWERAERILDELLLRGEIGRKNKVKVAVVFTHLDVWFSAVTDCESTAALNSPYLEALAQRWQGGAFLTKLKEFSEYRLFATGLYRTGECRPLDGADAPLRFILTKMGL